MNKLLAFLLCSVLLFADSSGPRSGTGSGTSWTNPTNVSTSDNLYASFGIAASSVSNTLSISTLGFAIPSGATITGFEVTLERKCGTSLKCTVVSTGAGGVWLTKSAGTSQGTNLGKVGSWSTSDVTVTMGDSANLWGSTWTQAEVNASGFGVAIIVQNLDTSITNAYVDYIAVTVYYTASGAGARRRNAVVSQTRSLKLHA